MVSGSYVYMVGIGQPHGCTLPLVSMQALIDGQVLCVHGGLSPDLRTLDQVSTIMASCLQFQWCTCFTPNCICSLSVALPYDTVAYVQNLTLWCTDVSCTSCDKEALLL